MLANEDLMAIVANVGEHMQVPIAPEDLKFAKRLPQKVNPNQSAAQMRTTRTPGILLKFTAKEKRDALLAAKHKVRNLRTEHCDPDDNNFGRNDTPYVYINLSLPRDIRTLFAKARELKRKTTVRIVICTGTKVVYKMSIDDKKGTEVRSEDHIEQLLRSLPPRLVPSQAKVTHSLTS